MLILGVTRWSGPKVQIMPSNSGTVSRVGNLTKKNSRFFPPRTEAQRPKDSGSNLIFVRPSIGHTVDNVSKTFSPLWIWCFWKGGKRTLLRMSNLPHVILKSPSSASLPERWPETIDPASHAVDSIMNIPICEYSNTQLIVVLLPSLLKNLLVTPFESQLDLQLTYQHSWFKNWTMNGADVFPITRTWGFIVHKGLVNFWVRVDYFSTVK